MEILGMKTKKITKKELKQKEELFKSFIEDIVESFEEKIERRYGIDFRNAIRFKFSPYPYIEDFEKIKTRQIFLDNRKEAQDALEKIINMSLDEIKQIRIEEVKNDLHYYTKTIQAI